MDPVALQRRVRAAEARISAAARALAQGEDLEALIQELELTSSNDRFVADMLKKERLANLMEAVAERRKAADTFDVIGEVFAPIEAEPAPKRRTTQITAISRAG